MNIIGHKNIFLSVSGFLILASLISITVWGLKPGIDFTGGSLLEIEFSSGRPDMTKAKEKLDALGFGGAMLQPTEDNRMIMRFRSIDETEHQKLIKGLAELSVSGGVLERRFDTIGPTIGAELKQKSFLALGLAISAIILYIAWAFRKVSKPVSSWKYGVVAVLALIHDVVIPAGVFAWLGEFRGVEIDALFITALLTILGFSVHDTIVVFDRIRENLHKQKQPEPFEITVNRSMNETLTRSVNTSFTVLIVLLAVFFLGGSTTQYFSLALILGVIFGTYSSIFIASPLLVVWNSLKIKR